MFSLKHLRLREQRRQSLQKFAQKAPQSPALKPPSTARTAGRSDRAERRFRRQSFILLFVTASSISLVSAENGENSLIPLRLLFPPNPLRWASAGALFSLLTIACRHLHLASDKKQHTVKVRLQHLRHKRRNVCFKGLRRVHTPPHLLTAHTAAHRAKHGAFWMGALSLPSERFARFGNPVGPGVKTANFAAFGPWSGVLPKNAESLRDSDALMRVAVPRRRGPAGLRDPIAVSLTALMGFTVLVVHDNSTQGKILAGFTRWSAPCVLPLAAVPLPCPQHPSAADKTDRWKTGSAGSCRADFRFACARPL